VNAETSRVTFDGARFDVALLPTRAPVSLYQLHTDKLQRPQ
jgi:hypothetical protein